MAFLLSSERPIDAALPQNPILGLVRMMQKAREVRLQRVALNDLLHYEPHRLDDLGITRQDVIDALARSHSQGEELASRRARRAKAWSRR